jgi:hypothetical protein
VTWQAIDSTLSERWVECFGFGSAGVVYAGFYGKIFKSTDGGDSWFELNTGIGQTTIQVIATAPTGTVIAGTKNDGVYRSTDGGMSWYKLVNDEWSSDDHKAIFFDRDGSILLGNSNGIFRSSDDGVTWTKLQSVPYRLVRDILRNAVGNLVIASPSGIAVSSDDGKSWTTVNDGLGNLYTTSLLLTDSGDIYTGTRGGGVYHAVLSTTDISHDATSSVNSMTLTQNYPNPFRGVTSISFGNARSGYARIAVYNALGDEVARVHEGFLHAGEHEFRIDAGTLPAGVYFCRGESAGGAITRRMLLIR